MLGWLLRAADRARHAARRKKWPSDQAIGRRGEDLAHRYLERQGFTIVARNYRTPSGSGEIDLVARDGERLVFVEVKCRQSGEFGGPERNVDAEKREQLFRAGRDYLRRAEIPWERARFDVVTVVLSRPPAVAHFRDVFPLKTL